MEDGWYRLRLPILGEAHTPPNRRNLILWVLWRRRLQRLFKEVPMSQHLKGRMPLPKDRNGNVLRFPPRSLAQPAAYKPAPWWWGPATVLAVAGALVALATALFR